MAMLYTTPVIVTVGISMSIPLALLGQGVIQGKSNSVIYWLGATLVFSAFMVINQGPEEEYLPGIGVVSAGEHDGNDESTVTGDPSSISSYHRDQAELLESAPEESFDDENAL